MTYPLIQKIQLDNYTYVNISYDEFSDSPRDWDNIWKLCIRKHRRYTFPNELDYCFECEDSDEIYSDDDNWNIVTVAQHEEEMLIWYRIYDLDSYEHSWIVFSLAWTWMQYNFETSRWCWFIAIPNIYESSEAREIAQSEISIYNSYLNWEVYGFKLYKTFPSIEDNGHIYSTDDELIDSCSGFYDTKDIAEYLPEKYREKFLQELN